MTTCEPCALHAAGQTERAKSLETIRAERIMLAILNGAADVAGEISQQVNGCHACTARLASIYAF